MPSSTRGLLRLASARSNVLHRARASLPLSNAPKRRWKSSLPSPAASVAADHVLPTNAFGNVLEVADWAKHAYVMEPRPTLTGKLQFLDATPIEIEPEQLALNRTHISDEDVDKWLAEFTIPAEQLAKCKTQEQVQEMRRLYARQLRLECSIYEMAVRKSQTSFENVTRLGRVTTTNTAKNLVTDWMEPAQAFFDAEQAKLRLNKHSLDSNTYGPAIMMLEPRVLAAIGLNILLNQCLMESSGTKFIKVALAMGKAVQEEIIERKDREKQRAEQALKRREEKEREEREKREKQNKEVGAEAQPEMSGKPKKAADPVPPIDAYYAKLKKNLVGQFLENKTKEYYDTAGLWDKKVSLKVGAAVIDAIQRSCFVPESMLAKGDKGVPAPAFLHDYVFERNRRAGVIKIDKRILEVVLATNPSANVLPWTARYLPMLVPPKKWADVTNGGYLRLRTKILRQRDAAWQMECVKRGDLGELLHTLNILGDVPWVINNEVLDVVLKVWENGGGFGDLPQRHDLELPEWLPEYETDKEKKAQWEKVKRKIVQRNQELHSLRCDTLYKLQVAEEYRDEDALYYPYNMDFRGRVYPLPPNLNHLGSDLSRSLLVFREKKPLGKNGLRWLKIHLANVFGVDKCSFDDRVEFTNAHLAKAIASASDPLGSGEGCGWWKDADYPFLALGVCFELKRALEAPNPEEYLSNLPIHQDGSCNGLQHYAALGRDLSGGEQVNLVPAPKPSDVYTGVATQVMRKVEQDASMVLPAPREGEGNELKALRERKQHAQFLLGTISRKVVKQTVMTSVYGVTYIGARKQIMARLEELFLEKGQLMDSELEDQIYHASCYAARVTMESMGDLFTSARNIMGWLGDCAARVAGAGQAMSWVTPLGLPVVQPYRKKATQQVRTKVQHVLLVNSEFLPVSTGRQKSAFPPNFVHSLDSTHMLLTAKRCLEDDKIAFAAVHDSYWTHASTVDVMNRRLREEFVHLYQRPLLEDLEKELHLRFPQIEFAPLPETGELDLTVVLDSPYFFN